MAIVTSRAAVIVVALMMAVQGCARREDAPAEMAEWYIGRHVTDLDRNWGKGRAEQSSGGYRHVYWGVGSGLGTCHVLAVVNHLGRIEAITAEQEGPNRLACAEALVHMPLQP